jgi:hypothetical protein
MGATVADPPVSALLSHKKKKMKKVLDKYLAFNYNHSKLREILN